MKFTHCKQQQINWIHFVLTFEFSKYEIAKFNQFNSVLKLQL